LVEAAAIARVNFRFDFFFCVGLGDLRGNIGDKDSIDVPVDKRAQDVASAQQEKDPKTAPAQDFASPAGRLSICGDNTGFFRELEGEFRAQCCSRLQMRTEIIGSYKSEN
jgi:hypothetical protein